jgi:hypothetical protein
MIVYSIFKGIHDNRYKEIREKHGGYHRPLQSLDSHYGR